MVGVGEIGKAFPTLLVRRVGALPEVLDGAERSQQAPISGTLQAHRFRYIPTPHRRSALALAHRLRGFPF